MMKAKKRKTNMPQPQQQQLPPVPPGQLRIVLEFPAPVAEAMRQMGMAMGLGNFAEVMSVSVSLLREVFERATQGDERVTINWNNGRPAVSRIVLG